MRKGHWKGGDVNFGYKLVDKKLQIYKEESVHIKKMFEMYEKGKSTKDIEALNASAILLWDPETIA